MMKTQLKIQRSLTAVITYVLLTCFSLSVSAQQTNQNKPPPWFANPPMDVDALYVSDSAESDSAKDALRKVTESGKTSLGLVRMRYATGIMLQFAAQVGADKTADLLKEIEIISKQIGNETDFGNFSIEKNYILEDRASFRAFVLMRSPIKNIHISIIQKLRNNKLLDAKIGSSKALNHLEAELLGGLEHEKREQQRKIQRVNLQVTHTQPTTDGSITITVQTNADTASLLINGEEQGGRTSGDYIIKKVARAGQDTKFTIAATDINGNKDTKVITVTRQVVESAVKYAQLNPAQVKKQPERDAVAVIIGIAKYESLPIAEFANDDARAFYDYAIRGLGVKPENIKLLVDEGAREAEILKTFRTWLPSRVKSSTEVFVFYSGHGLPTPDGSGLYLLPLHADRDVIDDTAIPFAKINDAISMAKPKSVTVILDACYSGQTKAGQTLVASARPLTLKAKNSFFPPNFTVISASQSDQISSSSPDLQHGIFSYYLMKGMEGDADMNKDGKITLGEMREYLVENVGRQAAMMSRKQEPQLIGDANRVLVGR
jgi:hypothetical protein